MRARLLALSILALVAAGCGDDDEETTVVETTTVIETVTTPREEPVPTTTSGDDDEDDDRDDDGPGDDDRGDGDDDGAVAAPEDCGRIAFQPNSDSGASGITAGGVSCRTARGVARAARNRGDDLSYEADGFSCVGTRKDESPLPRVDWICLRESAFVRFETT